MVNKLNPGNVNLIFGYDEIDNYFSRAWRLYEENHYYDALAIAFDASRLSGGFAGYYTKVWFPYLEDAIRSVISPELFDQCVDKIASYIMVNNLDQEKLLYIFRQFESMAEDISDKYRSIDSKSRTFYKLYDVGVSAYCHIGDSRNALIYYEKCKKYAYYVGVNDFLRTNNKLVVCLTDCFEWDKAKEIAKEDVQYQELICDLNNKIWNEKQFKNSVEEAKTLSQMGSVYALQRSGEAEKYFRLALKKFEKGTANYKITQSYLLHYYADMNLKEKYDEEIVDYFDGKETCREMLGWVLNQKNGESGNSIISVEYALYVLIRGIYYFHVNEIDENNWQILRNIDKKYRAISDKKPSGHPWEIIFKYLELISIMRGDTKARDAFSDLRQNVNIDKGETIIAIQMYADAEIADAQKDIKKRDAVTNNLCKYLSENFEVFSSGQISELDGDKRYKKLQKYFVFMYR